MGGWSFNNEWGCACEKDMAEALGSHACRRCRGTRRPWPSWRRCQQIPLIYACRPSFILQRGHESTASSLPLSQKTRSPAIKTDGAISRTMCEMADAFQQPWHQ